MPRTPLDRVDGIILLGIVGLGLTLRLVYLFEVWSIPFFEHPVGDALSYDEWAQRIAAGDWWGDRVFYQAPAYPYFLSVVYSVVGHDLWIAHVVQMILGALSCGLMFLAGRLFFDRSSGVLAGLLLAVYPPAIFFDGLIQKAGLGLFLLTTLLFLLALLQTRPGATIAWLCGAALGLLCLTRENALVFAPILAIWIACGFRLLPYGSSRTITPIRRRFLWTAGFAAGLVAVLVPVGARNQQVGGTFALTTAQMGPNFYIGNNQHATGVYAPLVLGQESPRYEQADAVRLAEAAVGRELTSGEVSNWWMERALSFIYERPTEWLKLLWMKALLTVNEFEIPDTVDIYPYAESSRVLGGLLRIFHFGVLLPLAAAGMVLAWRCRPEVDILYALSAAFAASVIAFYVFARYRYPLVPLTMPFAGFACVEGARLLRRKTWRALKLPAAALVGAALVSNVSLVDEESSQTAAHLNLGALMLQTGRIDDAEPYLLRALDLQPNDADVNVELGDLRLRQGRLREAESHLLRALQLRGDDPYAHRVIAVLYDQMGRDTDAKRHRRIAARLDPTRR
jgi:tetratricopeptide (TPR) repeat protein